MGDVVGLRGVEIADGSPVAGVVERLEWLLERARGGEIIGVAAAFQYRDAASGAVHAGFHSYGMIGRLEVLQQKIAREME
jgi:hypothetical protein